MEPPAPGEAQVAASPRRCPRADPRGPGARGQPGAAHAAGVRARVHVQPAAESEPAGPGLRAGRAAGRSLCRHRGGDPPCRHSTREFWKQGGPRRKDSELGGGPACRRCRLCVSRALANEGLSVPKVAEKAKHGQSMLSGNGVRGAHDEHGDGRGGERFRAEKGFGPSCLVSFGAQEGALWGSPTSRAQPLSAGGVEVGGGVVALEVLWWW